MPNNRPTAPLMPGFDFLKTLAAQAGAGLLGASTGPQADAAGLGGMGPMGALGGFGQWVAPTLDPDELAKRIDELRTVQFWLEQNARLLGATIQALEVQKMTLSTLRNMNVHMPDLQQMMGAMMPKTAAAPAPLAARSPAPSPAPKAAPKAAAGKQPAKPAAADVATGLVDPMKWWGALTEQFQTLASQALATSPSAKATSADRMQPFKRTQPSAHQKDRSGQAAATKVGNKASTPKRAAAGARGPA